MSSVALRCILATVREEVGPGPSDAELLRAIGDAAGEIAERKLGSITTTTPDIYAPIVEEACARVARELKPQ
jgi:hypothetical protein